MSDNILAETTDIVAAYLAGNPVQINQIPELLATVHAALTRINQPAAIAPEPEKLVPAVPIRKSVTPDYLVCLEDGKKLKMLKRHLRSTYSMTPEEYRARWNLPTDYPMVAPNYAEKRSQFAKDIGLGRKRAVEQPAPEPAVEQHAEPAITNVKPMRGRHRRERQAA